VVNGEALYFSSDAHQNLGGLDIFEVHEIEEAGDSGWARTSSAGRTRILAAGVEVTEGNNELFIFRREGGEWRIHRYLFATNQPRA